MQVIELKYITNNLDSRRIPLNSIEREKKTKVGLYPYVGANKIQGYIDEYIFDEKILCVAEDGGSWGKGEKCAVIINEKCWVNNHAHVLTAKDNLVLEYLMYYLNYTDLSLHINGATRGKLTQGTLNSLKIPLPPLPTQQKIAAILDKADELRQYNKQLIEKYDALTQSLFLDMFGDPVKNENNFPLKKLEEFYNSKKEGTKCGPFGGALKKEEFVESGIPVWNMDNISKRGELVSKFNLWITKEKYKLLNSYSVIDGDIIISRAGTVGKMCVVKTSFENSIISTNLIRLRLNRTLLLPMFFVSLMTYFKERISRLQTGGEGAFTHMNTGVLNDITFPYPPIDLQNQFAERVQLIETQKQQAQEALVKSEDLFQSLLQRAFKGEFV